MFLRLLNDNLKPKFLHLAKNAAETNSNYDDIEKELIKTMASEMNIEAKTSESYSEAELLAEIVSNSYIAEKKIMLFEIIAILQSDEVIDEDETRFLYHVAKAFNIDDDTISLMITYVSDYKRLYIDICNLLIK